MTARESTSRELSLPRGSSRCELSSGRSSRALDGSTIAFERAAVLSLARDAEDEIRELDAAAVRVASGTYGTCERCGSPIADARLEALPAARRCIACVRMR